MTLFRILTLFFALSNQLSQASCFEQLNEFLDQFKITPFHVLEDGVLRTNKHTHTVSIIDDLLIEVYSEDQIKLIAKAVYPQGLKRRRAFISRLKEQFKKGERKISLRLLAPEAVGELTNKAPRCDGPNCFNATLKWFYPDKELAETHSIEMDNYLRTHFKEIKPGKRLQFGDVLVWRDPQGELVHTAIYINENFSWHKATYSETSSWVFEKTIAINMMYGIDSPNHALIAAFRHKPRW